MITYYPMKYYEYYSRHVYYVVLAWKDIQDLLIEAGLINEAEFHKINQLIIWHDNSKIEADEFAAYAARFYPAGEENDEEGIERLFKQAWEAHKLKNPHHHQALKDYQGDDWKCYLVEMVCDWHAMGWEMGNTAYEYYEDNKASINLPSIYQEFLKLILALIKERDKQAPQETLCKKLSRLVWS